MWDQRHTGRMATAIKLIVLLAVLLPASASASAGTILGNGLYGTMAVDATRAHVFVSLPENNVVDELSYTGQLLATIPVQSPEGMVISGNYLYVAEALASPSGAIVKIDLTASTLTPTVVSSAPLNYPQWLVFAGGKLWATEAASGTGCCSGHVTGVDPTTGAVTEFPNDAAVNSIYDPDLATSPGAPNTLFVSEDGLSPGTVYRIDVSSGTPSLIASTPSNQSQYGDVANIRDLAVSNDGTRVLPAAGATQNTSGFTLYQVDEFSASTLLPDGVAYPTGPYPSAVATSVSGLVATGILSGNPTNDINVFRAGASVPSFSASVHDSSGSADVWPHGLAFAPDSSYLFVVAIDDVYPNRNTTFYSFPLPPIPTTPPTISCGAPPTIWSNTNVTIDCTATDNSGSGLANPADSSFTLTTNVAAGTANANAETGSHPVCDNDGNCATAGPIGAIKVDLSAPTDSCGGVPTGWSRTNVTVSCTASDTGSGLAKPSSDSAFTLSTTVATGTANATAQTSSRTICDVAGNCTTAGPLGPVEVDLAPPAITITSPVNGSTVKTRSTLIAKYSCADQGSGLASCTGTVPSGAAINTQQSGTFAFTVTAKDLAGNATTVTVHYTVAKH
jgi:hypothetical protein